MIFQPEILHGHTDAGFFKAKLIGDIYGTDHRQFSAQYQNSFQIIFGGFVYDHLCTLSNIVT